ncbi:L-asparaginase II [bacterium BMS3Bbin10]|nr:L-asparaginase II [bacterium BMS3Bbin10]
MPNPVLINLTRGNLIESFHRGSLCIVRGEGEPVLALGDVTSPVYPRSAIKLLQALPLVESGAADAFGLGDKELALACASHNGEVLHAETAGAMLAKLGLSKNDLACGDQWPMREEAARELAAKGESPTALHNNCSGKHAGMLTLGAHLKARVQGYEHVDHPVQRQVRRAIEDMTGEAALPELCGIDGCSLPTWAMPLQGLAGAFARLATFSGLAPVRMSACKRLIHACTSEPQMVEGTGRFGTGVMRALGAAAFVKGGAEGVYCAAFPEQGVGMALKMDDGARRGAEAVAAHVIAALFAGRIEGANDLLNMQLTNWRGLRVGEMLPSDELESALAGMPL